MTAILLFLIWLTCIIPFAHFVGWVICYWDVHFSKSDRANEMRKWADETVRHFIEITEGKE